jgi:surface carbohydrate biosynthesis protein
MNKKWFYIPVELKVRELQSKLLLALKSAKAGFVVIIGSKNGLIRRLPFLPRGIFMGFGIVKNYEKLFKKCRKLGHKVVAFDEEGLVFLNEEVYKRYRVSKDTLSNVELFFAWGEVQTDAVLSKAPEAESKVINTGSLRFDLMSPRYRKILDDEVYRIKKKYGPIILINSSFAPCNHFSGTEFYLKALRDKFMMVSPEDETFHKKRIKHMGNIFEGFIEMIPELSRNFRDYKIIVRPHPSENHIVWERSIKGLDNVFMVNEGNVIPWILASSAVIQNGCTTGVEAFFLGRPVIAYRPVTSDEFDIPLPNSLGKSISSVPRLIGYLKDLLRYGPDDREADENRRREIILRKNLSGIGSKLAGDIMIESLSDLIVRPRKVDRYLGSRTYLGLLRFLLSVKNTADSIFKGRRLFGGYQKHKFPGLSMAEIIKFAGKLEEIIKESFSQIEIVDIGDYCFRLTDKSKSDTPGRK